MRLIIGGYAQGKREYATSSYPEHSLVEMDYLEKNTAASDKLIITGLDEWVKAFVVKGVAEEEILCRLNVILDKYEDLVIITCEIGNGIVPMEKQERMYRDLLGKIQIYLAKKALCVERIICGIATVIK